MLRPPVRVCFVCSGNICRSPTAEVVLRAQADAAGLAELVAVSSAGTGGWHEGEDMDRRSRRTLDAAGYRPGRHAARQFGAPDFADLDLVVALDGGHLEALRALAGLSADPAAARGRIVLLREFDPQRRAGESADVGDPYYGGASGFRDVLDQIERSCAALLAAVQAAVDGERPGVTPA